MAITALVPQNNLISNSNGGDQITETQPTANTQKVIGYEGNNETTIY